jgi:hypothetical protein
VRAKVCAEWDEEQLDMVAVVVVVVVVGMWMGVLGWCLNFASRNKLSAVLPPLLTAVRVAAGLARWIAKKGVRKIRRFIFASRTQNNENTKEGRHCRCCRCTEWDEEELDMVVVGGERCG